MDETDKDDDIRTLIRAQDPAALELIWKRYASDMLGYLVSLMACRHDAEDVLQEVFVTIAKKRNMLASARKLKAYLFSMARNSAFNRMKQLNRMEHRHQEASSWLCLRNEADSAGDRSLELSTALAGLPEAQRTAVTLCACQGKTLREVGEFLGLSQNTVASRYRYGIAKLREILKGNP